MKYLKTIFVLFLLFSCQKTIQKHIAIGTWYSCNKDGSYTEYKITDQYMLILNTGSDKIAIFKNRILNSNLILSEFKNGLGLIPNNDTLVTKEQLKDKIILKSTYTWQEIELNKAKFHIEKIDSTNLETWRNKTLSEFKKRAESVNCPDLRTESEKEIPTIYIKDIEEEAIPISEIEN